MTPQTIEILNTGAALVTAAFTAVLSVGVVIASMAYRAQLRAMKVTETSRLISAWRTGEASATLDYIDVLDDYDASRRRALRLYNHILGLRRFKRFQHLWDVVNQHIQDVAALTEEVEIYLRKGVADEGIFVEHLGYDIIALYYLEQDVLQRRAAEVNYDYEGWLALARRAQDYATLHSEADILPVLVRANLSPLHYRTGEVSDPPRRTVRRRIRLALKQASETMRGPRRPPGRH